MKKILFLLVTMLSFNSYAQDDILTKTAKEICEYVNDNTEEFKGFSKTEKFTRLGLKMLALYSKYEKEFVKEGYDVNIQDRFSTKKFGEKMGVKMAMVCPETLVFLTKEIVDDKGEINLSETTQENYSIIGNVVKITGKEFNFLIIEDKEGKTHKFLWLQNFKGSSELLSEKEIKREVKVSYENIECYSPKLEEYIIRKKITKVEFID